MLVEGVSTVVEEHVVLRVVADGERAATVASGASWDGRVVSAALVVSSLDPVCPCD